MSRKKMGGGGHDDEGGGHGDRPWVYFMIDSFFLVTQFFVLTFKVRTGEDLILPHKLPPGGAGKPVPDLIPKEMTPVAITVMRETVDSTPWYMINAGERIDQVGVSQKLSE